MPHGPMACPVDGTTLVMSDRQGVEIDYCPQCRGVWLDRGELDKIIERSARETAAAAPQPAPSALSPTPQPAPQYQQPAQPYPPQPYPAQHHPQPGYGAQPFGYGHKRKKSFLEELFD